MAVTAPIAIALAPARVSPPKVIAPPARTEMENRPAEEFEPTLETSAEVPTEGADTANVWPDERAEAAFISETRARGEPVPLASAEVLEEAVAKPLPPLDEMVNRIPAGTRELLDELFRAKFTKVRRVKKSDLKN